MSEKEASLGEYKESDETPSVGRIETPVGGLPSEWDVVWLNDICSINPDGFSEDEWTEGTFEYISLSNVSEGTILKSQTIAIDDAPSRAQRVVKEGDILVGTVRPNQVSHGIVTEDHDGKICSSGFGVLRPQENLNAFYLLQEVLSRRFFRQMVAYVAGSGYPAVKIGDLRKHRIAVPPIEEQRKIASVLYTVDQAIQITEDIISQLSRVRHGVIQDLFRVGINEDGQLRSPEDQVSAFVETEYGLLPADWKLDILDNIVPEDAPVTYGIVKPGNHDPDGVPLVKVEDIVEEEVDEVELFHVSEELHEDYRRAELKAGDLLFSIRGTVGRMAFVPDSLKGANITQDTARIRIVEAQPKFIRYYFESNIPQTYFGRYTIGQAVQGINLESLRTTPVFLPSKDEQNRIVQIIETYSELIQLERSHQDQLMRFKKGLMQDLLSGEVRTQDKEIEILDEVPQFE